MKSDRHGLHLHDILHHSFIHTNEADVVRVTQWSDDLPSLSFAKTNTPCRDCMITKGTHRNRPPLSQRRATRPLELVHMDIAGPFKTSMQGNKVYFLVIVDDYSRKAWVYLLVEPVPGPSSRCP
eukprot:2612322-Rhodomonas_salina.1